MAILAHLPVISRVSLMLSLIFPSFAKGGRSFDHIVFLFPGKALNIIYVTVLFRAFRIG